MSVATKDGAWISGQVQTRIDCDRCGPAVVIIRGDNENEVYDAIREHAKKHDGIDRGY